MKTFAQRATRLPMGRLVVFAVSLSLGILSSSLLFAEDCSGYTCWLAQDCGRTGDYCYSGGYTTRCGFNCVTPGVPCTCYVTNYGSNPNNICHVSEPGDPFTDRCTTYGLCACSSC